MKKIFVFLALISPFFIFGETNQAKHFQIYLSGKDSQDVYIPYPDVKGIGGTNDMGVDTLNATTATDLKTAKWSSPSKVTINLVPRWETAEESDSLAITVHPLIYSADKDSFFVANNDSLFLVFDTRVTYTTTAYDWLNWSNFGSYICKLTSELWGTSGIVLRIKQRAVDATADLRLTCDVYFEY